MAIYNAYQSAELAAVYDAVYADAGDIPFWLAMAADAGHGPFLELGCGSGRLLLPLAQAGYEVVGIDLAAHMLERAREKVQAEPSEVRDRVTLLEGDMTAFRLGRRFAQISCAFGTFHHLDTVDLQLACLESCKKHLLPNGRLVLDLINPDPAPAAAPLADETSVDVSKAETDMSAGTVDWTEGRRIRSWATVVDTQRALQRNDVEVTYEIIEADGASRRLSETFPMRFVFRYELEHLLVRSGFRVVALYGDYDRSTFADDSLGMIVVAELVNA